MLRPAPVAAALLASALACSDSFAPTLDNVAGNYSLYAFTTTDSTGKKTDWYAAGATLALTLNKDGSTAGSLFVPGYHFGGGPLVADMVGTWSLSGDTVRFTQTADTFIRGMPFLTARNALKGDVGFADARVRILLLK